MTPLAADMELWLLTQRRWVSGREICARFGVPERRLRAVGGKPGLLTVCAISHSVHGFKHVRNATDREFDECDRRDRRHNISSYISLRARRAYRREQLTGKPREEKFSGQLILL